MTAVDSRIAALRAETIAAIQRREQLGAEARSALLAVLNAGRICRTGCADALTSWGLEPPPGELTVSADGQMSYTRIHPDEDDARTGALRHVPPTLSRRLPPQVFIWPKRKITVTMIPGGEDYPQADLYRITVDVGLQVRVTATSQAAAITSAKAMVNTRPSEPADADVTLTGLTWHVDDGPEDLLHPAGTGPQPATVSLPSDGDNLATATTARDAAIAALADLRRKIRHRAVTALADGEFGGEYQETSERVERFLLDLGFDPLPRAHVVLVTVDATLRVAATTAHQALNLVRDLMEATSKAGEALSWTAQGWGSDPIDEGDGWWRLNWRHVYDLSVRGHTDRAAALAAGEELVRAEAVRALADEVEFRMVVTGEVEDYGIDQNLDPDID